MAAETTVADRNHFRSPRLLPAKNLQFSNRNIPLLESHLSYCKQSTAAGSNRNFLRGPLFRATPLPENGIQRWIEASHEFPDKHALRRRRPSVTVNPQRSRPQSIFEIGKETFGAVVPSNVDMCKVSLAEGCILRASSYRRFR
jgi:hypothetical protein